MMDRSEILTAMGDLKLFGMKSAFDAITLRSVVKVRRCSLTLRLTSSSSPGS